MKKASIFISVAFFSLLLICCNKKLNPDCGGDRTFVLSVGGTTLVDSTLGYYYSYTLGSKRFFQWSELVTDVCPAEHVKVQFAVEVSNPADTSLLSASARVSYALLYERQ